MMNSTLHKRWFITLFFLSCWFVLVCPSLAPALDVPPLKARVNDYADILSAGTEQQLESLLYLFEQEETTQIVVLTISSLEGDNLESFSLRVVEEWKVGQKDLDNGALLLIAKEDRKLRIEVGYGLEGSLTDLVSGQIIRKIITPKFKEGNFDQGIIAGVTAIMSVVKGEFGDQLNRLQEKDETRANRDGFIGFLAFGFFFIGRLLREKPLLAAGIGGIAAPAIGSLFFGANLQLLLFLIPFGAVAGFIFSSLRTGGVGTLGSGGSSGSTYTGSSGGFGGGFGGGGGGFGGGGASGGW